MMGEWPVELERRDIFHDIQLVEGVLLALVLRAAGSKGALGGSQKVHRIQKFEKRATLRSSPRSR